MMQLIQRHNQQQTDHKSGQVDLLRVQAGHDDHSMLTKELVGLTMELKQLMGEELEGLGMNELIKLEKLVQTGLDRVEKSKNGKLWNQINELKTRESKLLEENALLKAESSVILNGSTRNNDVTKQVNSSGSVTDSHGLINIVNYPEEDNGISDTSLKLGLP